MNDKTILAYVVLIIFIFCLIINVLFIVNFVILSCFLYVCFVSVNVAGFQTGNFVARPQYIARAHICTLLHIGRAKSPSSIDNSI